MRTSHLAAALTAVSAGLTVAVALHRRAGSRLPVPATAAEAVVTAGPAEPALEPVLESEGVVLPFVRPAVTAPVAERPAAPARCGDSGGRTKAGGACAARATSGGRCHHHRIAA